MTFAAILIALKKFGSFCWAHKKLAGTILLTAIVPLSVMFWYFCEPSRTEKRIDDRLPAIIGSNLSVQQSNLAVVEANKAVVNANITVKKTEANLATVKANKQSGVSIDVANKNRCIAFPESSECK